VSVSMQATNFTIEPA
jgi:hypothetical protein